MEAITVKTAVAQSAHYLGVGERTYPLTSQPGHCLGPNPFFSRTCCLFKHLGGGTEREREGERERGTGREGEKAALFLFCSFIL